MRHRFQSEVFAARQPRAAKEREQAYERGRQTDTNRALYRTAAWRRLRALQLDEFPYCSTPGCGWQAQVVDHVTPHRGQNDLFFDQANLQSMCKRCHDRKTVREDGGFGNKRLHDDKDDGERGFGLL